jgi:RNA ligase (TIGR02306 family)
MESGLAWIGRIEALDLIPGADRIEQATVVCGQGGIWKGVVRKGEFGPGNLCRVYLQDSVLPQIPELWRISSLPFRVRICRFRGALSECLIMPLYFPHHWTQDQIGMDITEAEAVTRYVKAVPAQLEGDALGAFPSFIPKTDEPNFQGVPWMVEALLGHPYYVTEKADGSSATIYRRGDHFGCCSRNWEYQKSDQQSVWRIAAMYELEKRLPDGVAIQFELVGPKIQGNPMKLEKVEPRAFNAWEIGEQRYLSYGGFRQLCDFLGMPTVGMVGGGDCFQQTRDELVAMAPGTYPCGAQREGIVIRPRTEMSVEYRRQRHRVSFKVINPDYKERD